MDLYFQGMAWFNKGPTPEYLTQARGFLSAPLMLDPGNVEALIGTAGYAIICVAPSIQPTIEVALLAAAEATLTKALSLAPNHALAHFCMGCVQIHTNRAAQGIAECERALALDRNLAAAHASIGMAKVSIGRARRDRGSHQRGASSQSVRYKRPCMVVFWGIAKLHLSKDEEAVAIIAPCLGY